jgi:hypothetical protein
MEPDIRRIVAVAAHWGRTGRCPMMIHALGTGETFGIAPAPDGFTDVATGLRVRLGDGAIRVPGMPPIDLRLGDDVGFSGFDPASGSRFTGRAGGGSSVTIYAGGADDFYQYAVVNESGT